MDPNAFLSLLFVVSLALYHGGCGEGGVAAAEEVASSAGGIACLKQLLPCQPYLHSSAPPGTCCDPLKKMVGDNVHCLCAFFNNPAILKSLNVSQADALNLVKACGSTADASVCNNNNNNSGSTSPTASPSAPGTSTPSAGSMTNMTEATKSSAYAGSPSSGYGFIAIFLAALISLGI